MFAVPGWSVSPDLLKTQSVEPPKLASSVAGSSAVSGDGAPKSNKKRKHSSGKLKGLDVNPTNLADLWETVIEGKPKPKPKDATKKHSEKRQKIAKDDGPDESTEIAQDLTTGKDEKKQKVKTLKQKKREKKAVLQQLKEESADTKHPPEPVTKALQPAKPAAQLTPLQILMRQKLVSARFRYLNQTLYTTPSAQSLELFQQNPEMFQEYHEGFKRQVEVWPENPVDGYVTQVRQRGTQRGPMRSKGKADGKEKTHDAGLLPLPRTEGTCNIADLGCGDAGLSQGLQRDAKKLKIKLYSYDLQSPNALVTKADIANLPLKDGTVDIAIFCLALMGTNWIDFIEEAFRILRWKGELWVAEIKSRFGRVGGYGKNKRVEHSVGNRKKVADKKAAKKTEEEADDAALMVEVDGQEDTKQETDVSAFVEVLRKRGFVLQSEQAVDLNNKMFVKMTFVKGATPIKGKCVPVPKGMAEMGMETWSKKLKTKFLDDNDEDLHVSSEASVLKPCVYKLR